VESSKQPNGAAFRYISNHATDTVYKSKHTSDQSESKITHVQKIHISI
jgi:hypothetical protein